MIPVNAQWGMFILFAATLIAGVIFLVFLSMRVLPGMAESARERLGAHPVSGLGSAGAGAQT